MSRAAKELWTDIALSPDGRDASERIDAAVAPLTQDLTHALGYLNKLLDRDDLLDRLEIDGDLFSGLRGLVEHAEQTLEPWRQK